MGRRFSYHTITVFLWIFFICALGVPIAYLLKEAFWVDSKFTTVHFVRVFQERLLLDSLFNSINIALLATLFTFIFALPIAICMVRLRLPRHGVWEQLLLAPLFLPPFVGVLGIRQFLGRSGTFNLTLESLSVIDTPFDLLGGGALFGIALIQALHFYPLAYLGISAALASFNAEYEEAAESFGAGTWARYTRIIFPMLSPSIVSSGLLVFIGSFTDIGTPLLFEFRRTVPVIVFNSLSDLEQSGPGYALVCIVGFVSLVLFAIARYFEGGISSSARSFRSIRANSIRTLGDLTLVCFVAFIICLSLLPHLGVFLQAFSDRWFMTPLPTHYTGEHFVEVFVHPIAFGSLQYSVLLSIAATCVTIIIGSIIAWRVVRKPCLQSRILELFAMTPLALPGIVIAFGYLVGYQGTIIDNRVNPTALLILAYSIRKLPFMVRVLISGLQAASIDLENAARVYGARGVVLFRRITMPLLFPSLLAGSVLCFLGSLLEVSDSLLLSMEEKFFPIAKALYVLQGRPDGGPIASALSIVVMLVVIIGMYAAARISGMRVSQLLRGDTK